MTSTSTATITTTIDIIIAISISTITHMPNMIATASTGLHYSFHYY